MAKNSLKRYQLPRVIKRIIGAMASRDCFLLLGHETPDEDCIAAMVACALILIKFSKKTSLYIGGNVHEHFQYLLDICRYNSIGLLRPGDDTNLGFDTAIICDTPKPSMIDGDQTISTLLGSPDCLKIEIDHHVGADSEYSGDPDYRLVAEASSSCELVGRLALRLKREKNLLQEYEIPDPLSRNLVLAVLTGIIGDSKMGQFLRSGREKRFYRRFSRMFNTMLEKATVQDDFLSDKDEVFQEIHRLSNQEQICTRFFLQRETKGNRVSSIVLDQSEIEKLASQGCDMDIIVSTARSVADRLAENSGYLSLVVYEDPASISDLVQFRVRRSRQYRRFDLRDLLVKLELKDGGGHEGAIGFRIRRSDVGDYRGYVQQTIDRIEEMLPE